MATCGPARGDRLRRRAHAAQQRQRRLHRPGEEQGRPPRRASRRCWRDGSASPPASWVLTRRGALRGGRRQPAARPHDDPARFLSRAGADGDPRAAGPSWRRTGLPTRWRWPSASPICGAPTGSSKQAPRALTAPRVTGRRRETGRRWSSCGAGRERLARGHAARTFAALVAAPRASAGEQVLQQVTPPSALAISVTSTVRTRRPARRGVRRCAGRRR